LAWLQRQKLKVSPWFPSFLFFFICLQGAFGAWTVTLKLQPIIVSTHLMLGMGLLSLLAFFKARLNADTLPSSSAQEVKLKVSSEETSLPNKSKLKSLLF